MSAYFQVQVQKDITKRWIEEALELRNKLDAATDEIERLKDEDCDVLRADLTTAVTVLKEIAECGCENGGLLPCDMRRVLHRITRPHDRTLAIPQQWCRPCRARVALEQMTFTDGAER